MKKSQFVLIAGLIFFASGAMAQEIVPFTSFEGDVDGLWSATGGMAEFSLTSTFDPDVGVQPQDGEWHLEIFYNLALSQWSPMNVVIPDGGTVDITGMRELHFFTYFAEDAAPHQDGDYRMRLSIGGGRELGTQAKQADEVVGQWVEWVFPIDHIIYTNQDPSGTVDALTQVQFYVNPGGNASVVGTVYLDNIYFSRPANFPDELEYIQLWSFDADEDGDLVPDGWETWGQMPFIGLEEIEPSEGVNYMALELTGGWTQNGHGIDAKQRTDRLLDALDVVFDFYLPSTYTGSWLNLQMIVQSGGEDADGNPLSPTNGWEGYGERGVAGFEKDVWHTMGFPILVEHHRGALETDAGYFNIGFTTNQPADQQGQLIYIDNFRIAVPSGTSVSDWSLF